MQIYVCYKDNKLAIRATCYPLHKPCDQEPNWVYLRRLTVGCFCNKLPETCCCCRCKKSELQCGPQDHSNKARSDMGVDPNRRESSTIDRRFMIGQDGHENMCSSWERVRVQWQAAQSSRMANCLTLRATDTRPECMSLTMALIAVPAASDVNAAV